MCGGGAGEGGKGTYGLGNTEELVVVVGDRTAIGEILVTRLGHRARGVALRCS